MAPKIGCVPQILLGWVQRQEVDTGVRDGVATVEAQGVKELVREIRDLHRANEILKQADVFFGEAELDRRPRYRGNPLTNIGASLESRRSKIVIHHNYRGSQYVFIRYSKRLAEAGIEPSVGSRGDSCDNALAETTNGLQGPAASSRAP